MHNYTINNSATKVVKFSLRRLGTATNLSQSVAPTLGSYKK
nr:MAG TPA: hypothetical protein [Caudoviricetes sp.]